MKRIVRNLQGRRLPRAAALLAASFLLFQGCAAFTAVKPEGYAAYRGSTPFRAASPDGVVYRVGRVRNRPRAGLEFWREATRRKMVEAGYRLVSDSTILAGKDSTAVLELAAPMGEQDYLYLVALVVKNRRLVVAEAAGEVEKVRRDRERIVEAMRAIRIR